MQFKQLPDQIQSLQGFSPDWWVTCLVVAWLHASQAVCSEGQCSHLKDLLTRACLISSQTNQAFPVKPQTIPI